MEFYQTHEWSKNYFSTLKQGEHKYFFVLKENSKGSGLLIEKK